MSFKKGAIILVGAVMFRRTLMLILSVIFSVGLFYIANRKLFVKDGFVFVKGSAEVEVKADMVYWNINFVNSANQLQSLKNKNAEDLKNVKEFLKNNKIGENEYKINPLELIDLDTREYKDPNQNYRYIMSQSVSVISDKVDLIEEASQKLDQLIEKNVSLKSSYGDIKPIYRYTKINDIKQELMKQATISARRTAEQFAIDSKSKIGKIKYANQGVISVSPRNKSSSYENESYEKEKEVRAVITIEYWLK